jgi:hypothetical protein
MSFPHGLLEHPSRPASRPNGARACEARERMARHTLAAGGRRAVGDFFGFIVLTSPLGFTLFRFLPLESGESTRGGESREGERGTRAGFRAPASSHGACHSNRSARPAAGSPRTALRPPLPGPQDARHDGAGAVRVRRGDQETARVIREIPQATARSKLYRNRNRHRQRSLVCAALVRGGTSRLSRTGKRCFPTTYRGQRLKAVNSPETFDYSRGEYQSRDYHPIWR